MLLDQIEEILLQCIRIVYVYLKRGGSIQLTLSDQCSLVAQLKVRAFIAKYNILCQILSIEQHIIYLLKKKK